MTDITERLKVAIADRYVIERELGAGGMATVYLAQDLKHDRKVALKVLRPELAAVLGGERFVQEIKTTAGLQHPHILPLFDSGTADGFLFYVMPYIEGETLRDRLNRETQLSIEDAVRITTNVADALDYAHRHGVIHRDIKPENILLHDGRPMVADFGIALAVSAAAGGRMTETGMSLGTPHYMSPEQATAEKEITGRSDVYSLGSVLYEMLTGEPPHMGNSAQAIIMKIVTEDAQPVTRLRKSVPPNVTAAVATALEKLPADRFSSAASFAEALVTPGYTTPSHTRAGAAAMPRKADRRLLAATAGLTLMTALAAWGLLRSPAPAPVLRYGLAIPAASQPDVGSLVAVAPDGSALAYTGPSGTPFVPQVWLKPRASDRPVPLPGTLGAVTVTFSPDGHWLAFVIAGPTGGTLKKVQVGGGAAIVLADSVAPASAPGWLDDGTIIYAQRGGRGLRRVADGGGPSHEIWPADSGLVREVAPLPGSAGVLISRCPTNSSVCASRDIWVLDLRSGTARLVVAGGLAARYLPTGHILYVRPDGAGLVIPFDLRGLAPRGSPIAVLDSVAVNANNLAQLDVSLTGTLVVLRGALNRSDRHLLWFVDRTGRDTPVDMGGPLQLTPLGNAGWALSPDGGRLAISLADEATSAVWVKQLPAGPLSRVTFDSGAAGFTSLRPRWVPGGRALTYVTSTAEGVELRRIPADGTGSSEVLVRNVRGVFEGVVSPDGQWIVVRESAGVGRTGRDIVGYRVGDTTAVPLMANPAYEESAFAISPDGRWIAYESDETGRREVYLRPFPNTNDGKWQTSTSGGMAPLWARNGRELFFVDAARQMIAVTVVGGTEPRFGERRALFTLSPGDYLDENTYYTPFDVGPDGRFLMARRIRPEGDAPPLIITEHWFTELGRRLGEP